jgi:acetyl esterase
MHDQLNGHPPPGARRLDPDAQAIVEVMTAANLAPLQTLSVEQARERMSAALIAGGAPQPLHSVEDVSLPTPDGARTLRLYRPTAGVLPVALFLHGGGWTLNDLDTHDALCRRIAARSGWLLAALDYRRAPEHKYPAALTDVHTAYDWLLEHAGQIGAGPRPPALIGESSGGTLAAGLTLILRDRGAQLPTYQVLAYPLMDRSDAWPSFAENGSGYALDRELIEWFFGHYLPSGCDLTDPYLFPLCAQDLSGLPPTLIITAEFDALRDEGLAYAQRLMRAGVHVEHLHAADQMHSFLLMSRAVPRAGELIDQLADMLAAQAAPS